MSGLGSAIFCAEPEERVLTRPLVLVAGVMMERVGSWPAAAPPLLCRQRLQSEEENKQDPALCPPVGTESSHLSAGKTACWDLMWRPGMELRLTV